jgi:putative endonuclease
MYYIYILYSPGFDIYYIGHTSDPLRRLEEHNTKPFTTYTSKYRPWELKAQFAVSEDRKITIAYERKIKSLKSRRIIELLLANNGKFEILAQLVRVPTSRIRVKLVIK